MGQAPLAPRQPDPGRLPTSTSAGDFHLDRTAATFPHQTLCVGCANGGHNGVDLNSLTKAVRATRHGWLQWLTATTARRLLHGVVVEGRELTPTAADPAEARPYEHPGFETSCSAGCDTPSRCSASPPAGVRRRLGLIAGLRDAWGTGRSLAFASPCRRPAPPAPLRSCRRARLRRRPAVAHRPARHPRHSSTL